MARQRADADPVTGTPPGRAVPSPYARTIRDLATGRVRDYNARLRRFDGTDWQRYADFLDTAFALAVGRRFRPGQDRAPIIRFVAAVRETHDRTGAGIDPTLAEHLMGAALGERPPAPADRASVAARTLLLIALLDDEGSTGGRRLDAFLHLAEDLARTDDPTLDSPV